MKFLVRYSSLSVAYYIACMLSLMVFTYLDMRNMEHHVEPMVGARTLSALCLIVCVGAVLKFYWVPDYKLYRPTNTMLLYIVYLLWIFAPILLNDIDGDSASDILYVVIKQIMPVLSLLITYNYMLNHGDSKWFGRGFCVMLLIYAYGFLSIMFELLLSGSNIQMIVSYYTVFVLPLIMLTCGKKTCVVFVLITLLVLIMSMKRGGIVALFCGLAAYGVTYVLSSKKINVAAIIGGVVASLLFAWLFVYVGSSDETNVVQRFEGVEDDNGSGRTAVWYNTIQLIENSDFLPLIFGHGYNKVVKETIYGLSAHNDFLEITYDYGAVGLILYMSAFVSLAFMVLRLIRGKSPDAPAMAMFFTIYLILSMISHVMIYTWANIILFTISYVSAREKLNARSE